MVVIGLAGFATSTNVIWFSTTHAGAAHPGSTAVPAVNRRSITSARYSVPAFAGRSSPADTTTAVRSLMRVGPTCVTLGPKATPPLGAPSNQPTQAEGPSAIDQRVEEVHQGGRAGESICTTMRASDDESAPMGAGRMNDW